MQALLQVGVDEPLAQPMQCLGRDARVAHVGHRVGLGGEHDRPEAQDRAGGSDHPLIATLDDLIDVRADLVVDVRDQPTLVAAGDRIGSHEPLGEPDDANLEAPGQLGVPGGAEGDLDAAAADVDDDPAPAGEIHAVGRREVDETRLFLAGDDLHRDPGLAVNRVQEVAAVLGLACGAGRCGDDLVDVVRVGEPAELRECLERGRHRRRRQRLAVEPAGPEADHFLLAVHDLEGEVRSHLHDDDVDRVGADVDRCEPHDGGGAARPGAVLGYGAHSDARPAS